MAILAECPICHRAQKTENKKCKRCGEDLDKAKKAKRVRYWVDYRVPVGLDAEGKRKYKRKRELVKGEDVKAYSIEDARAVEGNKRTLKKEKRFFDMIPEAEVTFNELAEWYKGLEKVKALKSYKRVEQCLQNFLNRPAG